MIGFGCFLQLRIRWYEQITMTQGIKPKKAPMYKHAV